MQPAPRRVYLAEASDILENSDGVSKISDALRTYLATEAVGAIHQQVMRLARFRRTAEYADAYIAEFDLRCRGAESEMEMGAGPPDHLASMLRIDNAAVSRNEGPLVMASCRKGLRFEDA